MKTADENTEKKVKINQKFDLIDNIIALELEMFLQVNSKNSEGKSQCQEEPETFKLMRWMSHSVLSQDTLESYLVDLLEAKANERNFMTEKYALMEGIIPHLKENPIIDKIAEVEINWMKELKPKYPNILKGDTETFKNYMVCEYETYSDKTLELLMKDINTAQTKKLNLPKLRYKNLFKKLGYKSLEEAEQVCCM